MGKAIHWELCKKFKFEHTNKWYMYKPESVLANETHKLVWDFEVQMDHLISWPDLEVVNKKKRELAEMWTLLCPADATE